MKSVGIDIGTASIKVAEIHQTKKGLMISQYKEFALGQNPGYDSNIEIVEFLRTIADKYRDDLVQIVVGLRQEMVSVRNKVFPFSDRLKILKSLPFELEEDLPFSPENAIYDAKIVQYIDNSAEVLACAAPKHRIAELLGKMKDAGLEISLLSSEGTALANCWENWDESPRSTKENKMAMDVEGGTHREIHLVLSIGHTRTLVLAFEDEHLVGLRSIFWGGKNLAELIMKKYELPYIEALNVLQTRAFILLNQENSTYDQIVFSQSIAEGLAELAQDVKMTMLEFQSEINAQVVAVSLTGGVSRIKNMHAFLTQTLEVPVNTTKILTNDYEYGFQPSNAEDAGCGVALGLAIEGLKKPRNPALNFMKQEFQKQNQKLQALWEEWGGFVKLGVAAFLVFSVYSMIRDAQATSLIEQSTNALKKQAREVAHLSSKQAGETSVKKFLAEQRKRSKEIKDVALLAKMNSPLDILRQISEAVPDRTHNGILVRRLSVQNQRVEIEGSVPRSQDLNSIQTSLNGISLSGKIEILTPRTRPATGVPFAFGFSVDRGFAGMTADKVTK